MTFESWRNVTRMACQSRLNKLSNDARLCIQDISDEALNNQLIVARHKKLLDELGLPYEGINVGDTKRKRNNHCHHCKRPLDSQRNIECNHCRCMRVRSQNMVAKRRLKLVNC